MVSNDGNVSGVGAVTTTWTINSAGEVSGEGFVYLSSGSSIHAYEAYWTLQLDLEKKNLTGSVGTTAGSFGVTLTKISSSFLTVNITSPEEAEVINENVNITANANSAYEIIKVVWMLFAIHPNGYVKWQYLTDGSIKTPSAIDADGTIYLGTAGDRFYAINPDGTKKKWEFEFSGYFMPSPLIGSTGTIFSGIGDLIAINQDGTEKWRFDFDGNMDAFSPVLSSDGILYIPASNSFENSILYAIDCNESLANTPWPMFQHDIKHTGRAY